MSYFKYKYLKILNMHFIDEKWSKIFCLVSCGIFLVRMYEWMNAWMMHLYSVLLCIVVHPKRFTIMGGGGGISPQPPPVCSIHLDDAMAATGQRRQCAHHTPATGGEERESWSQSSGWGLLGGHDWQGPMEFWLGHRGYTPTLYEKCHEICNDHRE